MLVAVGGETRDRDSFLQVGPCVPPRQRIAWVWLPVALGL